MNWPLMRDTVSFFDKLNLCKFILQNTRLTQGVKVKEFEAAWNNWLGSKYSIFVNSGSSANLLLLDAVAEYYNIPKGSKILVPATTWTTTASPIIQLGFQPIFCDVDLHNFGFDESDLIKISKDHPDIRIVFTAHLLGLRAPIEKYKKLLPSAIFIEDICESHGVAKDKIKQGSNSVGATFSFYFGHHMTTVEGGMISTNNKDIYDLLRMKRSHGLSRESENHGKYSQENTNIDPQFLFITLGYNFRNMELNAKLGLIQLNKLDNFISERRKNYKKFLSLLDPQKFLIPEPQENENSSFCLPFICKQPGIKEKLKSNFISNGVEYRPIIAGNLLNHPAYKTYSEFKTNANFLHSRGLYIGNNQFLTNQDFLLLENILKGI